MAGSKPKGIPSWQKESPSPPADTTTSSPIQNDDPVYAQAQAAKESPARSDTATSSTSAAQSDDPVYAQQEAANPSPVEESDSMQIDDPVYAQAEAASSTPQSKQTTDSPSGTSSDPDPHLRSRSSLLASASKFLQHEDLATAPLERKVAFLQEKGLTKEEIDGLLTPSSPSSTAQSSPAPPIITYPEFLSHAHRPKPLVTRTRIINAVYATGLISGALYLANRYLFEPMAGEMTAARHDLFSTAQKGVDGLNERLEKNVSVVPPVKRHGTEEEAESVASDPDELFHRDVGVQTSPKLEGENVPENTEKTDYAVLRQISQLRELKGHMDTLSDTGKDAQEEDEATSSALRDLQAYLEGLQFGTRTSLDFSNGYAAAYGMKPDTGKMDEIAKFKAEIRSVKGALLSARNFPSGGSVRAR